MSLFLRQACQPLLDGVGLPNYHIQVDENSKCLQVVGECGDVLTSITGIRLSRMAPAEKEISLAVSLFDDFLAKHADTFKGFIAAKVRADKAAIPMEVEELLDAEVDKQAYQDYWRLTFNMSSIPSESISVRSTGLVSIPSMGFEMVDEGEVDIQHQISTKEKTAIIKWLAECQEYNTAITLKTKLLAKLSSCEI